MITAVKESTIKEMASLPKPCVIKPKTKKEIEEESRCDVKGCDNSLEYSGAGRCSYHEAEFEV